MGRSEGKIYRVCWWAQVRDRLIQCVGGQNTKKGLYSLLVGRTEGNVYRVFWWAELQLTCIECVDGEK